MRRWTCLGLAMGTIGLGLAWRLVPLGMPLWLVKYGGSGIWGTMVYWLVAAAKPGWARPRVSGAAVLVAWAVELFKLVHAPGLDAFRVSM